MCSSTIPEFILEAFPGLSWEPLARFAYECYHRRGRGVVVLDKPEGGNIMMNYVVYDRENKKPDPEAAEMIRIYDPRKEIVIRFLPEDGNVHTMLLSTPPGERDPWRIWLFSR